MKVISTLIATFLLAGLTGCLEEDVEHLAAEESASPQVYAALIRARSAEAHRYAPGEYEQAESLYRAAKNAGPHERSDFLQDAEAHAERATERARLIAAEARTVAERELEVARLVVDIVQKLRSHGPGPNVSVPGETELEHARVRLREASAAFESGDYVTSASVSSEITQRLAPRGARGFASVIDPLER